MKWSFLNSRTTRCVSPKVWLASFILVGEFELSFFTDSGLRFRSELFGSWRSLVLEEKFVDEFTSQKFRIRPIKE